MVVIDLERLFALPQHAGDLSVGHLVVVAEVEDQPLLCLLYTSDAADE